MYISVFEDVYWSDENLHFGFYPKSFKNEVENMVVHKEEVYWVVEIEEKAEVFQETDS